MTAAPEDLIQEIDSYLEAREGQGEYRSIFGVLSYGEAACY